MIRLLSTLCISALICGSVAAQDQSAEGPLSPPASPMVVRAIQSDDGQLAVQQFSISSSDGILMADSPGAAINFGFAGPVDSFSLLSNPSVQKDLELVDDQVSQIRDLQREFGKEIQEQLKNGVDASSAKSLKEVIQKMREEQKKKLDEILLGHQRDRLEQVALQTQLKNAGTANALSSENFAELLGITDEQKERLKERSKELNKKLQEKIKQLREQIKKELLEELTVEQRKKLKELLGDKYESKAEDWRSMIRRRTSRSTESGGD